MYRRFPLLCFVCMHVYIGVFCAGVQSVCICVCLCVHQSIRMWCPYIYVSVCSWCFTFQSLLHAIVQIVGRNLCRGNILCKEELWNLLVSAWCISNIQPLNVQLRHFLHLNFLFLFRISNAFCTFMKFLPQYSTYLIAMHEVSITEENDPCIHEHTVECKLYHTLVVHGQSSFNILSWYL